MVRAVKYAGAVALGVVVCFAGVSGVCARQDQAGSQAVKTSEKKKVAQKKAAGQSEAEKNQVFKLGEVEVVGQQKQDENITVDRIYNREMRLFDANNVATAANLDPGVSLVEQGQRNQYTVDVRGFDIRGVPLFVDGIPIYVPYDGYPDLSAFKTFNISELAISKGFTSVLYGANTEGGAINVLTRKPQKEFEVSGGSGYGTGDAYHGYMNFGSNQGKWFIQGGGYYDNTDYFPLSGDFSPTKTQPSGNRVNSYQNDWSGNVTLGLTPNSTDEYAFSFMNMETQKGVPPYAGSDPHAKVSYWQWPSWDVQLLDFHSYTQICEKNYLKTTAFYDKTDNKLFSFNNENYDTITYPPRYAFISYYNDYSFGASAEAGTKLVPNNFIKAAFHFKDDVHKQWETIPVQPVTRFEDRTYSAGIEDTITITKEFYSIAGASYDWINTIEAQETPSTSFPIGSSHSFNPQLGLFYKLTDTGVLYATVARKSRLPSIKEKFSSFMSQGIPSPDLQPEKTINYDIGYKDLLLGCLHFQADAFYNDVTNYIIYANANIPDPYYPGTTYSQMQNIGKVHLYGVELGLKGRILPQVEGGFNYSYLQYVNGSTGQTLADLPHDKVFAYLQYFTPLPGVSVLGSLEYNSDRFTKLDYGIPYAAKQFTLINLKGIYDVPGRVIDCFMGPFPIHVQLEAGINNITDENWELEEGFPLAGRTFFGQMRFTF
ncbi:MAG: TonB-dependent receptor plug domain-containing protein [Syntrophobacteraceae bacterium]